FWCCRPWLPETVFTTGQVVVLLATWKIASLLCLPPADWARLPWRRLLAYLVWIGMQPRQFLVGYEPPPGTPVPTGRGWLINAATGAALFWLLPHLLPAATPWAVRVGVAVVGYGFVSLLAGLDLLALLFRAMGFPVDKQFACPVAAATVGEFWGQ